MQRRGGGGAGGGGGGAGPGLAVEEAALDPRARTHGGSTRPAGYGVPVLLCEKLLKSSMAFSPGSSRSSCLRRAPGPAPFGVVFRHHLPRATRHRSCSARRDTTESRPDGGGRSRTGTGPAGPGVFRGARLSAGYRSPPGPADSSRTPVRERRRRRPLELFRRGRVSQLLRRRGQVRGRGSPRGRGGTGTPGEAAPTVGRGRGSGQEGFHRSTSVRDSKGLMRCPSAPTPRARSGSKARRSRQEEHGTGRSEVLHGMADVVPGGLGHDHVRQHEVGAQHGDPSGPPGPSPRSPRGCRSRRRSAPPPSGW
jgi:hypothetical protein